ncbi:MAG: metallopeptidase family protein [Sandaracinobacter sp.]
MVLYSGRMAQFAPSLAQIEQLAQDAVERLPDLFRQHLVRVILKVEDFPDEDVTVAMELESPFDLLGLYWGHHVGDMGSEMTGALPPTIFLYRRALLDEWANGENSLEHLVTHVLVHEVGHHFGLSDADMDAIEAGLR